MSYHQYWGDSLQTGFFADGAWGPSGPAVAGMNLNHWADAAWAEGSWVAAAWGVTSVLDVFVGYEERNKRYRKRTEEHAKLRQMLESLYDGPVPAVLLREAEVLPTGTPEELSEWVSALVARERLRQEIEDEDEVIVLMAGL